MFYRWQPLPEIHFNPIATEASTAGDPIRVATCAAVGLFGLLPALVMLELLLPAFRVLLRFTTEMDAGWDEYGLLTAIAGIVGLACGAWPALVLSATRPQTVLRTGAQQGMKGGPGLRTVLVAVQFCLASMLLNYLHTFWRNLLRQKVIAFTLSQSRWSRDGVIARSSRIGRKIAS